jgi:hypothetical protein
VSTGPGGLRLTEPNMLRICHRLNPEAIRSLNLTGDWSRDVEAGWPITPDDLALSVGPHDPGVTGIDVGVWSRKNVVTPLSGGWPRPSPMGEKNGV